MNSDLLQSIELVFHSANVAQVLSALLAVTTIAVIGAASAQLWTRSVALKPLAKIPCPAGWPIVGDTFKLDPDPVAFYNQILEFSDAHRKSGILKLTIFGWCTVGVFAPEYTETLLRSTVNITKAVEYDFMHSWLGTGLLTSAGGKWKTRRKLLTPSFHFNILKEFLPIMTSHSDKLVEKLQPYACDGKPVDVYPFISLNALDIICETAMGVNMDALNNDDLAYVKAVYLVKDIIALRQRCPWFWPDFIFYNLPRGRAVKKSIRMLHEYAFKVISERRNSYTSAGDFEDDRKRKAFLDTLLDCTDENGMPLTDEDIREEVDTFMFEGHDTVSAALSHALHLLGSHPEIQAKCQQELDSVFESSREVSFEDLSRMPYLERCIKETLRLYPSVPWFGRNVDEDIRFGEYVVPKGTSVGIFASSLHRNPDIYPNPEEFNPDRFSPDVIRHPYAYIPFSAGPRNCIGQRFAMNELKVILSTLLRKFTIEATQERKDIKPNPGLVLQPTDGIWVKLSNR